MLHSLVRKVRECVRRKHGAQWLVWIGVGLIYLFLIDRDIPPVSKLDDLPTVSGILQEVKLSRGGKSRTSRLKILTEQREEIVLHIRGLAASEKVALKDKVGSRVHAWHEKWTQPFPLPSKTLARQIEDDSGAILLDYSRVYQNRLRADARDKSSAVYEIFTLGGGIFLLSYGVVLCFRK